MTELIRTETACPQCKRTTVATNRNATLWICPVGHKFPVEGSPMTMEKRPAVTDVKFNPSGSVEVHSLKAAALEYERIIRINTPDGRDRAVALTHLKTCSMWAVSSLFPVEPPE